METVTDFVDVTGNGLLIQVLAAQDARRERDTYAISRLLGDVMLLGGRVRVPVETEEQFRDALGMIGGHNRFFPDRVADAFGPLVPWCMRVEIEWWPGGPALYFKFPYHVRQVLGRGASLLPLDPDLEVPAQVRQSMCSNMIRTARMLHADSITVEQNRHSDGPVGSDVGMVVGKPGPKPYVLRLWWD